MSGAIGPHLPLTQNETDMQYACYLDLDMGLRISSSNKWSSALAAGLAHGLVSATERQCSCHTLPSPNSRTPDLAAGPPPSPLAWAGPCP